MAAQVVVEFDCGVQTLSALQAAAYRLIGTASCEIETADNRWICRLTAKSPAPSLEESLRVRFLDLVTDENLRHSLAAKTEPTRNLILALAFGSLAGAEPSKSD